MTRRPDESAAVSRGRSVLHASAAGAVFQGVYALSQFVILGLILRAFGSEQFGMWTTAWAIGAWALVMHLGVQSSLLTRLGAIASTDRAAAGRALKTALVLVGIISAVLIVLTLTVGYLIPWSGFLNVQGDEARRCAQGVALAVLVMTFLGLPMSLGAMGLLGCQRGSASFVALIIANVFAAALVALGVWRGWSLVLVMVMAMSPPIVAGLMQWWLLLHGRGALTLGAWDKREAAELLRVGSRFFVMQVFSMGLLQSGAVIIAARLGAEAVTPYAAMFRLIGLALAVFLAFGYAYWPAFADAAARDDRRWFERALGWSFVKTLLVWSVTVGGIFTLGDWFIGWWLGKAALPDMKLKLWMVVFIGLYGLLLWIANALNGMGRLGVQVVSGALMLGTAIPLAGWLSGVYGQAGVPIALSCVIALIGLPVNGVYLARMLRRPGPLPTPRDDWPVSSMGID